VARGGVAGAHRALENEIAKEMALALGRSAEHVMDAIRAIDRADEALRSARGGGADSGEIEALRVDARLVRERAEVRLWELIVHREALGLFDHSILQRFYPIPPPRHT
jgi:hypothetical protein